MSQTVLRRTDSFRSSDADRHARPLQYVQSVTFHQPLSLELGGQLTEVTVAYETYGRLNTHRDNAVLICHALSGDSHVARHDEQDDPGWWDVMVGPGKPIDTNRYFVICPNVLGGCRGTTGPNTLRPGTDRPYGAEFPTITIGDIVEVQRRLVDHLQIGRLRAVVGGSLGGHMTLTWAIRFPDRLAGAVALATSPRLTSQALAFDVVGRNAILQDPDYHGGQYYGRGAGPKVGLAIARMLGHITYLSREAMTRKFDGHRLEERHVHTQFETKFCVGSYLAYQGDRFVDRFDANSYLVLTKALDLFDLGGTPEELRARLSPSQCRWLVLSFSSDWLFPPFQSQEIVDSLIAARKPVTHCNITSDCGHDAFLLEADVARYGEFLHAFLGNLDSKQAAMPVPCNVLSAEERNDQQPTSIFRQPRLDYDKILELIPPGASVLDLGCGAGGLLARLRERGHRQLMGIELSEQSVLACTRRGLDVVQADLNAGLATLADGRFDFVVLSQTLQAVMDVERVVDEMLRVGVRGIVSFPNIAHHTLRGQLAWEGRAPRICERLGFRWYNTPNLRFLSIADFQDFCRDRSIRIHQLVALDTRVGLPIHHNPNSNADVAIVVVSR